MPMNDIEDNKVECPVNDFYHKLPRICTPLHFIVETGQTGLNMFKSPLVAHTARVDNLVFGILLQRRDQLLIRRLPI